MHGNMNVKNMTLQGKPVWNPLW